jgi:dTDP-L-rhamnose 4-epimerase
VLERDEANFEAFNVGSGTPLTVTDYAHAVLKELSSSVLLDVPGEYRRGDNRHSVSSIQKLCGLGWRPRRTLSVILRDFLNWIESRGGIPQRLPDAYSQMRDAGVVLAASR